METVKVEINRLLDCYLKKAISENSYSNNWELFKYESSKLLRSFSSSYIRAGRAEEDTVISSISSIMERGCLQMKIN